MELFTYWLKFPPTHLLLRAYVGYKGHEPSELERKFIDGAVGWGPQGPKAKLEEAQLPEYAKAFLKNPRAMLKQKEEAHAR